MTSITKQKFMLSVQGMVGVDKARHSFVRGELSASKFKQHDVDRNPITINGGNWSPIALDTACKLKKVTFGGSNFPLASQMFWTKSDGIDLEKPGTHLAYGLKMTEKTAPAIRDFLMCVQPYLVKFLLFDQKDGPRKSQKRRINNNAERRLHPSHEIQNDMLVSGFCSLLQKMVGPKGQHVLCLPGEKMAFEPSQKYAIDGVTEFIWISKTKKEKVLKEYVQKCLGNFMAKGSKGVLCLLYSCVMTRGLDTIDEDLQDQAGTSLLDPNGQCTQALINLMVTGQATPYMHNGSLEVQDLQGVCHERLGIAKRNDTGLLVYKGDDLQTAELNIGAMLKTPSCPMWVTVTDGKVGLVFNANPDLVRSYRTETRFQLNFYPIPSDQTTPTTITIDTNVIRSDDVFQDDDAEQEPKLNLALRTKWADAVVRWEGRALMEEQTTKKVEEDETSKSRGPSESDADK